MPGQEDLFRGQIGIISITAMEIVMFRNLTFKNGIVALIWLATTALGATQVAAEVSVERADVVGQGLLGPVVAQNGAKLVRSETGLNVSIRIPRPQMGTYDYPAGNMWNPDAVPGHPEAFSFWVFVFNYPEECIDGCGLDDFGAGRGAPAAFNPGGHLVGNTPYLQLSGRVSLTSEAFLPVGGSLIEPETAEVHFAIAPHGALNPEYMPSQIKTPIGSPDQWWLAIFYP